MVGVFELVIDGLNRYDFDVIGYDESVDYVVLECIAVGSGKRLVQGSAGRR